jgi:hypothetical protein
MALTSLESHYHHLQGNETAKKWEKKGRGERACANISNEKNWLRAPYERK